ncbi:MAG TPA: OB-fold domain-containing protein [Methylomirabilota bacterium]|nr:OB-fold domain-containing protein [Methylomirabilota bacterium]
MSSQKPLPRVDDDTRAFWAGLARGALLLQHCLDCGAIQFYQRALCGRCLSARVEHRPASGRGVIYSFSTVYRPPSAEFKEDVPYTVVIVELAEGPRMISTLVEAAPDTVRIGQAVEIVYEPVTPEIGLPRFRPIDRAHSPG